MMTNYTKTSVLVLTLIAALSGCKEQVHDVAWYKAHDAARQKQIAACRNNPGELQATTNCQNATAAENSKILSSRGVPQPVMPK